MKASFETKLEKVKALLAQVGTQDWQDWQWQFRHKPSCSDPEVLAALGVLPKEWVGTSQRLLGITPYTLKLLLDLKEKDPKGFKAQQLQSFFQPTAQPIQSWTWARKRTTGFWYWLETILPTFLRIFFFGKGAHTNTPTLENMYPLTDVIIATAACARNCSFCFRGVGDSAGEAASMTGNRATVQAAIQTAIERRTPHVLITGGDPFTLSNEQLEAMLQPLVESPTVEVIRIGTRAVIDLTMRFDGTTLMLLMSLSTTMRKHGGNLRLMVHINHPSELTPEVMRVLGDLRHMGIQVWSQTVALRGINDNAETLRQLFLMLDRLGVIVYKLYHTMPVEGTNHLRVPIRRFRKLLADLHQWIPSTAVPHGHVVTLNGKQPVSPAGRWSIPIPFTSRWLMRNWLGQWYLFKDAWDPIRFAKEMALLISFMALLITVGVEAPQYEINPRPPAGEPINTSVMKGIKINPAKIKRVSTLADDMREKGDYVDAFFYTYHQPFVSGDTIFIPVQMKNTLAFH